MPVSLRTRSLRVKNEPEEEEDIAPPVAKRRPQIKVEISKYDENEEEQDEEAEAEPIRNVEEIRRKNLEDNKAFLEGLLMTQIRDDFKSLTNTLQPTVKKEGKKNGYKYVTVSETVPVRRSRRLAHMDINGNKLPSPEASDEEMDTVPTQTVVYRRQTQKRVVELSPEEQAELNEKIKVFFESTDQTTESKKSTYQFSDLKISDENVLKLTPDRLIFMDIHTRSDIVAIIGCDRKGTVGLVVKSIEDLHRPWSKINYDFHTAYATCCRFDPLKSNCIHSTAYDATFRAYDITKNISSEIFNDPNGQGLTAFDYRSAQTCVVAEDNGDVLLMDLRVDPVTIERFDVSKKRLRTLHINPLQSDEFCVAGLDKCVNIWDLRNMSTVKYSLQTDYSCYGAYYNQAGSHIMATTRDDHLISFTLDDVQKAANSLDIQPTKRVHHRNYVNRFVTPFTAQPYSSFESHFLIGSNAYPRAITVADENCKIIASMTDENLNSLATVNIAHRTLPVIVGGNSSGRIHVFTSRI